MTVFILILLLIIALLLAIILAEAPPAHLEPFMFTAPHLNSAPQKQPRLVVTFSAGPSTLRAAFQNVTQWLSQQTRVPDAVYACLPFGFTSEETVFSILQCEDYGPATSLYACAAEEQDPDTLLLPVDAFSLSNIPSTDLLVRWAAQFPDACVSIGGLDCSLERVTLSSAEMYAASPGIYSLLYTTSGGTVFRRRFVDFHAGENLLKGNFGDIVLSRAAVSLGATLLMVPFRSPPPAQNVPSDALIQQQQILRTECVTEYVWTKSYFLLAQHFDPRCFFFQAVSTQIDGGAVQDGDIICIRPECLSYFAAHILPRIMASFILITCDSTQPPSPAVARLLLEDKRLITWFSTVSIPHTRRIPLGVDYFSAYFQVPGVPLIEQEHALDAARLTRRQPGIYEGRIHFRNWTHVASFMSSRPTTESEACEAVLLGVHVTGKHKPWPREQLKVKHWQIILHGMQK